MAALRAAESKTQVNYPVPTIVSPMAEPWADEADGLLSVAVTLSAFYPVYRQELWGQEAANITAEECRSPAVIHIIGVPGAEAPGSLFQGTGTAVLVWACLAPWPGTS